MSLWTPSDRVLRRPDLRGLVVPRQSAAPLTPDEVDYDDLDILRSWRVFEPNSPGEVRYFMYLLSQRDVGAATPVQFYKAVRFLRVTRVPRYLRQMTTSAGGSVFGHQRKLLAGLREQQVLFINMVAKSPKLPLVFAWGVQAVGATPEEAQAEADRSFSVLQHLVEGVYQQLEFKPLTMEEGEHLVRYQTEWRSIAMARGRPKPLGADGGSESWLDGNRTDVENTQNMLESFIRGMGERSFLMSMVTVPVSPVEMSLVWRNLARKLSAVRSEQSGSRAVSAGFALPLGLSSGEGQTDGTSHTTGATHGSGTSDSVGHTDTHAAAFGVTDTTGTSLSETHGTSASVGHSQGVTDSVSESHGVSMGHGVSHSEGITVSDGISVGEGTTVGESIGTSHQVGESVSHGISESASESVSVGQSSSMSHGVSTGQSLAETASVGQNWSSSISDQFSSAINHMESLSQSNAVGISQGMSLTDTVNDAINDSYSASHGGGVNGGLLGFGGSMNATEGSSFGRNAGHSSAIGGTLTSTGTLTSGIGESLGSTLSRGLTLGETLGGSSSHGLTTSASVGESLSSTSGLSHSMGMGRSVGESMSTGASQSHGISQGASLAQSSNMTQSASLSQGATAGQSSQMSETAAMSAGRSVSAAQSVTEGVSASQTAGVSASTAVSRSESLAAADSVTSGVNTSRAESDAYVAALSRSAQTGSSLGIVPNLGLVMQRNVFDEGKRVLGDMLEAQMQRYVEGIEAGAFLYQLFLQCEDQMALSGAAGLLKGAFWGPGGATTRLPQPFHVVDRFGPDPESDAAERDRLLTHAAAFTSYRKRERSVELVEPYQWSTYLTAAEGAAMTHPPAAEALGLLAVHDSMPVFAMPYDRADRDIYLGHIINGERARVSNQRYGLDLNEIIHVLVAGETGSGKTTTLTRLLFEATRSTREVVDIDTSDPTRSSRKEVPAGALVLDWAQSFRGLAAVVPAERFKFFSITNPDLGEFRFNPLAIPSKNMAPVEWANTMSDLFMVSFGLGEFARSIFYEKLSQLYTANRLQPYELRAAMVNEDGVVTRPALVLPPVDRDTLPVGAITTDAAGNEIATVFTCPELSRLVSMEHLAVLIASDIEFASTPDGAKMLGRNYIDRLQTVWRRVMAFAPGGAMAEMMRSDDRLDVPEAVQVTDLIDPDRGLVTIIEADGLDMTNRRFILGGLLMAVWRYGQAHGKGCFDQDGKGPGTFVILEEAHELFGSQGDGEDREAAATRVAIYESMFRRARQIGLKLIAAVQNPADVPDAILGNVGTVVAHQLSTDRDKQTLSGLFNWMSGIGQHYREIRYLGEMAVGHMIIRMRSRKHFLEAAPVHVAVDPPALPEVSDQQLAALFARHV